MGDSRDVKVDFKGMVTAPGLLMRAEASCTDATNLLFEAPGVVRKRRGFEKLAGSTGGPNWKMFNSRTSAGQILTHVGTSNGTALYAGTGSGALVNVPIIGGSALTRADNNTRMNFALCQKNHYVTSTEGVARIESTGTAATQRFAGMPRGVNPGIVGYGVTTLKPTAGRPIADGYARAYRITWHKKDADGVEMGGAPTGRGVAYNITGIVGYTGVAAGVELRINCPRELGTLGTALTTSHFWRLWGTRTWNAIGGEFGDDEMYLIAEAFLTAGEITATYATYTDLTPDSYLVRQRRLHTNAQNYPSNETGAAQGTVNEDAPPPTADDVAYWNDVMWYAGISYRQRTTVRLLATAGTGLVANDTITVTGPTNVSITITAKAAPAGVTEFPLFTGLASSALNVEATAMGIVECINDNAAATLGVRAYYVSVGNMTPGYIYLEALTTGTATTIGFGSSRAAAFSYGINGGSGVVDAQPNGLAFSKPERADAVPPVNLISVGPADSRVLKIHPYRDRLLVFTDAGIFQVVGRSFADFAVLPFDLTYRLMVRESVVSCDDRVYAWTYEGIIEISNSGVEVISTPVEPTIAEALRSCGDTPSSLGVTGGQTAFALLGFAIAYRHEHRVQFFYPEAYDTANLNGCSYWLTFDTRTRAWSRGRLTKKIGTYQDNRSCGTVDVSSDLLVMGNWSSGADTYLFKERRALAATDYQDTAQDGTTAAIESEISFQYQVPEIDGAAHWQQATIHFEGGELTWRPVPTTATVTWLAQPDAVSASVSVTSNTAQIFRAETPTVARRGNRSRLTIQHVTAEFFGLIGVTQSVRVGSRFIGRGT